MLTERNDFDRLFQDKFRDFSKNPPENIWEGIESRLDAKIRRRRNVKILSLAASFLLILSFGLLFNRSFKTVEKHFTSNLSQSQFDSPVVVKKDGDSVRVKETPKASAHSMASFGANLSAPAAFHHSPEGEEPVQPDIESHILSHIGSRGVVLNKITELFTSQKSKRQIGNMVKTSRIETAYVKLDQTVQPVLSRKEEKNSSRWMLGIQASPVFTYGVNNLSGQLTKAEQTFSAGVRGEYKITKRLGIQSGVSINQIKLKTTPVDLVFSEPVNSPAGEIKLLPKMNSLQSTYSGNQTHLKQQLDYIEIPLFADYKVIDRKLSIGVTGGISANILRNNKAVFQNNYSDIQSGETENMRTVSYAGAVGLELSYNLGKKLSLTIEPLLKHYLTSLSSRSDVNFKPYQFGIYTGVKYSFD